MIEIFATIFGSITVVLFGVLGAIEISKKESHRKFKNFLWGALAISIVFGLAFQFMMLLHIHTYKSDLVLRYEDKFDDKMIPERAEASLVISEYLQKETGVQSLIKTGLTAWKMFLDFLMN
jgi:hypothetical protein